MSEKHLIKNVVGPLTSTLWNQDTPYSYVIDPSGDSYVGCVGVAFGQLMKYYNYPLKAKGILPGYHESGTDHEDKNIDGYEYQWSLMPDILLHDPDEIEATGTLLSHTAFAAETRNTLGNVSKMLHCMVNNFGYDENFGSVDMVNNDTDYVSYAEAASIIKEELDYGQPVILSARNHSLLCVGYTDDDTFIFNYGWTG